MFPIMAVDLEGIEYAYAYVGMIFGFISFVIGVASFLAAKLLRQGGRRIAAIVLFILAIVTLGFAVAIWLTQFIEGYRCTPWGCSAS
jgi:hypothetical protein